MVANVYTEIPRLKNTPLANAEVEMENSMNQIRKLREKKPQQRVSRPEFLNFLHYR